jgi:hypothetical protein
MPKPTALLWQLFSFASLSAACLPIAVSKTEEKLHQYRVHGKTDVDEMGNLLYRA